MRVDGDIRKRIFHEVCNQLTDGKMEFDRDAIIRNIIVFDHFIIKSFGLEIPILIDLFGFYGLKELLEEGVISFHFDFIFPGLKDEDKLPEDIFKVTLIKPSNIDESVSKCLANVNDARNITYKQKIKLKGLIAEHYSTNVQSEMNDYLSSFDNDIVNTNMLIRSVKQYCFLAYGNIFNGERIKLDIDKCVDGYKIKSNINDVIGQTDISDRMIIKKSIFGILSLNRSIYKMKQYNAMPAFNETEIPLYDNKLNIIASNLSATRPIGNFNKVITLANFPDFTNVTINTDKLLKLRKSEECVLFRDWLWTADNIPDKEINDIFNGFRNRIGDVLNKPLAKTIRWLASTGLSVIEPTSGIIASVLDSFMLEKVFPKKGLTSFINDKLPSIFNAKMDK